jgi:hypothetical protein
MDAEGIWAWMDNYCRGHPIETVKSAIVEFVLRDGWIHDPPVPATSR